MTTFRRKIAFPRFLAGLAVCGVVVVCMVLLKPSLNPRVKDTAFMREYAAMHVMCSKLRWYADEHHTPLLSSGVSRMDMNTVVRFGILSSNDTAYIQEHDIQFNGFDPNETDPHFTVMETIYTNTKTLYQIVGYSDGSVVAHNLHRAK